MNSQDFSPNGAAVINTPAFAQTVRAVAIVAAEQAMGVCHGVAGLGKTFAVAHGIDVLDIEVVSCVFPQRTSTKAIAAELLLKTTGVEHREERRLLTEPLIEQLSLKPRLIVVDEAQWINRECFEFLRFLWDAAQTRFGLLLCGGNDCWQVVSREPMLLSRMRRVVHFEPLPLGRVLQVMPSYHPIFRHAASELLVEVDDIIGHGNFRRWAIFTVEAANLAAEVGADTLTTEISEAVFSLLGGGIRQ